MYKYFLADDPRGVPEPLHGEELEPVGQVGILHLQQHFVVGVLRPPPDDDHGGAAELDGMLVARQRLVGGVALGRDHPVPLPVAVFAQPPGVVQRVRVRAAAAVDDHHARG